MIYKCRKEEKGEIISGSRKRNDKEKPLNYQLKMTIKNSITHVYDSEIVNGRRKDTREGERGESSGAE